MKRAIQTALALSLLLALGACGAGDGGESGSSGQTEGEQKEHAYADSSQSVRVPITDPQYVYLPKEQTGEDLVFSGWEENPADSQGDLVAKYQDVSQVQNAIVIPAVYGQGGEQVSVPLRICGQVDLCALDLRVTYDKELLRYAGSADQDEDLLINCDEENGVLLINFLRLVNLEEQFEFANLVFDVTTTHACDTTLWLDVVEAVALDEEQQIRFCNFSVVDGVAHLNRKGG